MSSPTPALVSGPGALSQRTDGGQPIRHIADAKYGEDKQFVEQQKGAPLAESGETVRGTPPSDLAPSGPPPGATPMSAGPPPDITPFGAPSSRPHEPVTAGSPLGPGPGPQQPQVGPGQLTNALSQYFAADDTGVLQQFAWALSEMGI